MCYFSELFLNVIVALPFQGHFIYLFLFSLCMYVCMYVFIYLYLFFWLHCVACGILVPRPGVEPRLSAVKAQSPNHWTTRAFPQVHFGISLLIYIKNPAEIFDWHCIESVNHLGENWQLNNTEPWTWYIYLLRPFLTFLLVFCSFNNWLLHIFCKINMYFMLSGAVVNGAFKISICSCPLLVCRNRIEFCMPNWCLTTLLNSLGIFFIDSNVIGKYRKFDFFLCSLYAFYFFFLLYWTG